MIGLAILGALFVGGVVGAVIARWSRHVGSAPHIPPSADVDLNAGFRNMHGP